MSKSITGSKYAPKDGIFFPRPRRPHPLPVSVTAFLENAGESTPARPRATLKRCMQLEVRIARYISSGRIERFGSQLFDYKSQVSSRLLVSNIRGTRPNPAFQLRVQRQFRVQCFCID